MTFYLATVVLCLALCMHIVHGRTRTFELNLARGWVNPDCSETSSMRLLVNGQHPAPPIRMTKGDHVQVVVRNAVDSGYSSSIHFHGILQVGTTESDGMPNITQAAIPPGETFVYEFNADQVGTYFYHAHVDLQDDTIHGPFIIYESDDAWPTESMERKLHEGIYEYDDERIVMLSEWWHQDEQARLNYVMGPQYTGVTVADSYLINGRTIYNPAVMNSSDHCEGYAAIDVLPGQTYRIRVIGSLTFATLGFAVAKHTMTIIEVDGELVKPYQTSYLEVASGQRFSVLLTTDQPPSSYFIATQPYYLATLPESSNGLGVLRYITEDQSDYQRRSDSGSDKVPFAVRPDIFAPSAWNATEKDLPLFPPTTAEWIFPYLEPVTKSSLDFQAPPDRTIVITPIERRLPDNTTRWFINNREPSEWRKPLLYQLADRDHLRLNDTAIQLNQDGVTDGFDDTTQSFPTAYGEVVDFVIQTTILTDGACAIHPWHTHGYVHYSIANGAGEYIHSRDKDIRTYPTPIAKDTTPVYPMPTASNQTSGTPCGWTKIRIHATNPGLWAFHCHITSHMLQGMLTVIQTEPEQISFLKKS